MPIEKKPDKPKPTSSQAAPQAKQTSSQAAPAAKQITIQLPTLTLDFGPRFEFRLAILGFAILLFAFALFLFARSNFAISDVFDYSRIEFNAGKLYSLNFGLFLVLYSLSMALVIAYGLGRDGRAVESVYANDYNPMEGGHVCVNLLDYPRKKAFAWKNILDKI